MNILITYLCIINALAFLLMHADKARARKKYPRIPEHILLVLCALGGSLGGFLGMKLCHHKTRRHSFRVGIPVMILLQAAAIAVWCFR